MPSMSMFRQSSDPPRRTYVRTATALATKSAPPPPEPEPAPPPAPIPEPAPVLAPVNPPTPEPTKAPSPKPEEEPLTRPSLSYAALIAQALDNLPNKKGTLTMIYNYIIEKYAYYRHVDPTQWQNSIRHNLSIHKTFIRGEKESKGHFWSIQEGCDVEKMINKKSRLAEETFNSSPKVKSKEEKLPLPIQIVPKSVEHFVMTTPPDSPPEETNNAQILENFLGHAKPPQKKVTVLSAIDVESEKKSDNSVPIPPTIIAKSPQTKPKISSTTVPTDKTKLKNPYLGSIDFWEQYDPDEVSQNGQAIITTESVPSVESVCFLCGSAGQESMIYCLSCCEPFHTFCLQPEDLPQTSEIEKSWVCKRCSDCQICGNVGGERKRCSKCCKAFHEECILPSQRKKIDGKPWVRIFFFTKAHYCYYSAVHPYYYLLVGFANRLIRKVSINRLILIF